MREGHLEDGGIWVAVDVGLIGRKRWVKHRWTADVGGERYAVGQDQAHRVIAYAPVGSEGSGLSLGTLVSRVIRYSLLAVVITVWALLGFAFWIPLIARATVGFCITAIYANLVTPNADVPNRGIQHAAHFYLNGFRSIYRAVVEPHSGDPESTPTFQGGRFFSEAVWAIFFWWVLLFAMAYFGVALSAFREPLAYPVVWVMERVRTAWAWLMETLDVLAPQTTESVDVQTGNE